MTERLWSQVKPIIDQLNAEIPASVTITGKDAAQYPAAIILPASKFSWASSVSQKIRHTCHQFDTSPRIRLNT
jgi:hypothetical protein